MLKDLNTALQCYLLVVRTSPNRPITQTQTTLNNYCCGN